MTITTNIMNNLEAFVNGGCERVVNHPQYQVWLNMPPVKRWSVLAGVLVGVTTLFFGLLYLIFGKIVVIGFFASILAGLATGAGALPALFFRNISNNLFNSLLGAAAGVMLAATAFSLLVPGIASANALWPGKGIYAVSLGMIIGALFLHFADSKMPHVHFDSIGDKHLTSMKKIWLFIIAITIHNFPEGMSVGVSFGAGNINNGVVLAIAIALQNIPEGLAVALPLVALGYDKWRAVGIALVTGLVEPVGGLLGITMVTIFQPLLPLAMGFAAGAMLFVISEEIIPETHSNGRSRFATFTLMLGFIVMMILDNLLG